MKYSDVIKTKEIKKDKGNIVYKNDKTPRIEKYNDKFNSLALQLMKMDLRQSAERKS